MIFSYYVSQVNSQFKEISGNSAPKGWEEHFSVESDKYEQIEQHLHAVFADKRCWAEREYFDVEKERAVVMLKSALALCGGKEIAPEETNGEEPQIRLKRRVLPLTDYAPIGSELVFTRDENIKCKIIDKKRVECEGEVYSSLSKLAGKLAVEKLGYAQPNVAGTDYFMYRGRILNEVRNEIYDQDD